MAGLKKKKKEPSSSPNVVVVVFLVFFVLATIVLGSLYYMSFEEKGDARRKQVAAVKDAELKQRDALLYKLAYYEMRVAATGDQLNADDEEKTAKEGMLLDRDEFLKEDFGKFGNGPKDKDGIRKLRAKILEKLEAAANGIDFKSSLEEKLKFALDDNIRFKKDYADEVAKNKRMETLAKKYTDKQDAFQADITNQIKAENDKIYKAAVIQTEAFKELIKEHAKLKDKLEEKNQELLAAKEDAEKEAKKLTRKVNVLEQALRENAGGAGGGNLGGNRPAGDAFPLVLDLTPGKPLWDTPVGKVVRVDLDLRQVSINLGSAHGVVPELTFNVFGTGPTGRAEKGMRGTIEVIKVIDSTTSLCRITSVYDAEGREIPLTLLRDRLLRESDPPLREGDLLFNLFWGTRVAVAGYVSLTGDPSDNPAEQMRQVEDFMHILKRNGIQVDAYVDLRDGQVRGSITPKTRYLIRGDDLRVAAAKMPDEEKDKDKDKEPKAKEGQPNAERNETINKSNKALRAEAIERGLLLISAENFATVVGYRKARSVLANEASNFRPGVPFAGQERIGAAPVNQPPPEEKKAEEKKDVEKKDKDGN